MRATKGQQKVACGRWLERLTRSAKKREKAIAAHPAGLAQPTLMPALLAAGFNRMQVKLPAVRQLNSTTAQPMKGHV